MMKKFVGSLFFALLACSVLISTTYSDDKALRKEVEGLYSKVSDLMAKKDISTLVKMMTDDCKFIDARGQTINRQQWETIMKQQMATAKNIKFTFKVQGIQTKGNMLMVKNSWDGSMDIVDAQGKVHKMKIVGQGVDTLVKAKDGWKLKLSKADKETVTLDGKPVSMEMPPVPKPDKKRK